MPEMGFYRKYSFVLSLRRYSAFNSTLNMPITTIKKMYNEILYQVVQSVPHYVS